jgi:hypothetical protein
MPGVRSGGVRVLIWLAAAAGLGGSIMGGAALGGSALGGLNPVYQGLERADLASQAHDTIAEEPVATPSAMPASALESTPGPTYADASTSTGKAAVFVPDAWERQAAAEERRWQARWDADAKRDQARIAADLPAAVPHAPEPAAPVTVPAPTPAVTLAPAMTPAPETPTTAVEPALPPAPPTA